ncbi:hypothetical protein THIARS_50230 [Thiomonas delicata]|uniref:LigXa-like C-terminal domain-containing protein n=2 Tax=Thiomonas delicata TaxID=364030 RepID=A0A238D154_THIDL|nr:hypothetical protein THIARS_50230 [Thiomonas delicata]
MVSARVDGAEATGTRWLRPSTDKAPRMQVERTAYGFRYADMRRPINHAASHVMSIAAALCSWRRIPC